VYDLASILLIVLFGLLAGVYARIAPRL